MRIVAVADTHLYHDDLRVPDGDVFVHAGDLCRAGTLGELRIAVDWIRGLPHRHKLVVAGNHDQALERQPAEARALLAGLTYLEDEEVRVEGQRFWGSPWQPEYNFWAFNLPRGAPLAEVWARIPAGIDVLVTHGPPEGIGDRTPVKGRGGCADLRRRVELVRPKLHLFGHIHQDGGVWPGEPTTFANVTTWECERGPTVLDLEGGQVRVVHCPEA